MENGERCWKGKRLRQGVPLGNEVFSHVAVGLPPATESSPVGPGWACPPTSGAVMLGAETGEVNERGWRAGVGRACGRRGGMGVPGDSAAREMWERWRVEVQRSDVK
jgi:hypothetical protein